MPGDELGSTCEKRVDVASGMEMTIAEVRRTGIGGGDIAAIVERDPYKGPSDVWRAKVEGHDSTENKRMKRGRQLQEPALNWYAEDLADLGLGLQVRGGVPRMRHPSEPWWLGEPDGMVYDTQTLAAAPDRGRTLPCIDGLLIAATGMVCRATVKPERLVEIKTHGFYAGRAYGEEESDDVPWHYLCQVTWYMGLCNVDRCDFGVVSDTHEFRRFTVYLDVQLLEVLLDAGRAFWNDYVVPKRMPPPDGSKSRREWIRERLGKHAPGLVALATPEQLALARSLAERKAAIKALEKDVERDAQVLQEAMGEAESLVDANGRVLATWKANARGTPAYKDATYEAAHRAGLRDDEIDALIAKHRGAPARPFVVAK